MNDQQRHTRFVCRFDLSNLDRRRLAVDAAQTSIAILRRTRFDAVVLRGLQSPQNMGSLKKAKAGDTVWFEAGVYYELSNIARFGGLQYDGASLQMGGRDKVIYRFN